jgi:branched-chain amino acid transport system permease protein
MSTSVSAPATQVRPQLRWGLAAYVALVILAMTLAIVVPKTGYILNISMQATTYAIAVLGLTVVLGLCGQINLAQAAFFGIGAYAVGIGQTEYGVNFWVCLLLGMSGAAFMGAVLGASTLKLGGHYLAMVTISFQQIVTLVLINWIPVTKGPDGVRSIPRPALFTDASTFLALCIGVLAACGYLLWRLRDTQLGRAMRAVRDNELAASVAGIDVYRTKVMAFAISSILGGLGGGLFAAGFAYVSPDQFSFAESVVFLTMVLLGGVSSPIGAAIGTGLLILIPEWLRFLKSVPGLYLAIYGAAVILIVLFMPDGIWGFVRGHLDRFKRRPALAGAAAQLQFAGGGSGTQTILELKGLSKHFGGLKAVDEVDLAIRRGGVHALIGPNGSGKTTTLNVISGLYRATSGKIFLNGRDVTDLPPHARTVAGLGRTFQNIRLWRSMTAMENVMIGAERPGSTFATSSAAAVARARAALAFVDLEARADELVAGFSYGHQRAVEIARALAADPVLLLLDEPGAGLNSSEKVELRDLLKRISARGLTILIIDHDMTLVSEVAQHITVLNFGRRIADGYSADVLRHPDVVAAYLGTAPDVAA